jgi:hypothetical protein
MLETEQVSEISIFTAMLTTEKILLYVCTYCEEWKTLSQDDSHNRNAKIAIDNYDDECCVPVCF